MANEITVTSTLSVKKGNLSFTDTNGLFRATMNGSVGGAPGLVLVPTDGVSIDLSALDTPGVCKMTNLDATNYVEYGIRDPDSGLFYPLGEIQAGESYIIRLSRNLKDQFTGTGTALGVQDNTLFFKAFGAECAVVIVAFEA